MLHCIVEFTLFTEWGLLCNLTELVKAQSDSLTALKPMISYIVKNNRLSITMVPFQICHIMFLPQRIRLCGELQGAAEVDFSLPVSSKD